MDLRLTSNFRLSEVVPKREFERFQQSAIWLIDMKIVYAAQFLRDQLKKPCIINNWKDGGSFEFSGFRPADCTVGAQYSQHRYGRALDLKFEGLEAEEVRQFIREKYVSLNMRRFFTTIEKDTVGWVHIDRREIPSSEKLFEVAYQ